MILVSGETMVGQAFQFGIEADVANPENHDELSKKAADVMHRAIRDGEYLEVADIQYMVRRQFLNCPKCGTPSPVGPGMNKCAAKTCGIDFTSAEWAPVINKGNIIQLVLPEQRSLTDGTVNRAKVNPNAIAVWDVVQPEGQAYKMWLEVAKSAEEVEMRRRAKAAGIEIAEHTAGGHGALESV